MLVLKGSVMSRSSPLLATSEKWLTALNHASPSGVTY